MIAFALPTGFTVDAVAVSTWNGFPVPMLSADQAERLEAHVLQQDGEPYRCSYDSVNPTRPWRADGLQWERVL